MQRGRDFTAAPNFYSRCQSQGKLRPEGLAALQHVVRKPLVGLILVKE